MGETSFKKFPPHPFQELAYNRYLNKFVSLLTDGRREVKPRFGYRELPGTTETLVAQKVERDKKLATNGRPFFCFRYAFVFAKRREQAPALLCENSYLELS